jgi:hypothetical protein
LPSPCPLPLGEGKKNSKDFSPLSQGERVGVRVFPRKFFNLSILHGMVDKIINFEKTVNQFQPY